MQSELALLGLGDYYGLASIAFLVLSSAIYFGSALLGKRPKAKADSTIISGPSLEKTQKGPEQNKTRPVSKVPEVNWQERLKKGLSKTRSNVWGKIDKLFSQNSVLEGEQLEQLEEILYGADIGPKNVQLILSEIESEFKGKSININEVKQLLFDHLYQRVSPYQKDIPDYLINFESENDQVSGIKTKVIMVVGVNGAGKTTTIGKLATKLSRQGARVVVGACDTFRAAAVDQLQVWCDRAGAQMVRAKEGSAPSGVGYQTLEKAINEKADYCILDTAGRLHTKDNLMDELAKSKNVLKKLDASAPHQILLVIDAITGQNAMRQAEEFHKAVGLTGLIFTKCDGSSKAGGAISIVDSLKVPITYIGVGESVEDLDVFNASEYLETLLEHKSGQARLREETISK